MKTDFTNSGLSLPLTTQKGQSMLAHQVAESTTKQKLSLGLLRVADIQVNISSELIVASQTGDPDSKNQKGVLFSTFHAAFKYVF